MWRELTVAGVAAAVLTMAAACDSAPEAADDAGADGADGATPAAGEMLTVVGPFEVHSIDPSTNDGFFTRLEVAETLVDADTEGTLQPGLATGWEVADDQLTWSFELRSDARFHDGSDVTGEEAAAALTIAHGKPGTPISSAPIAAVEADVDSVQVTLTEPYASLPAVLAHTSAQILAPESYDDDGGVVDIIGTGPYEVRHIDQPAVIEVVASDHWEGTRPQIEEVRYEAVSRAETRALMAESGQAHVVLGMEPASLQRLTDDENLTIESVTLPRTILLKVNAGHEVLGDAQVRQALSLALDREGMTSALLRDPEMAATQLFPPALDDWHQPGSDLLPHDPEAARDLLEQAGWTAEDGAVATNDGRPFEVTLRTFPDRPELPPLATAIQASLEQIGVEVDVRVGNSSDIPAGHQDGTLELALFSRNFALVPDPLVTLLDDLHPDGADWGAMGWSDPTVTDSLEQLVTQPDAAATQARIDTVLDVLHEQLPLIPVAWYRQSAVVSDVVEGFELDPLERSWLLSGLSWAD